MKRECVLILDNIRSVENTGSIFRTADCLGVHKLYLIGTTPAPIDRFGRKRKDFAKVALGAEESVSWEHQDSADSIIDELQAHGTRVIALEQSDRSKDLKNFEAQDSFALVIGNEVEGISRGILDRADDIIEIEMKGKKESLNVAVASGIALYSLLG